MLKAVVLLNTFVQTMIIFPTVLSMNIYMGKEAKKIQAFALNKY